MYMNMYMCLWVWALGVSSRARTRSEDVDVLVLLPRNNSYMFSITKVSPAIEYARQQLTQGPLAGLNFSVQYVSSECGVDALYALVDRTRSDRPNLILGPVCEYAAASVIRVASHWQIPVISAGALASGFSNKHHEYALLTRVAPSYLKMAKTFATMSQHFGWRSVHLIYQDDKEERNCYFIIEGVHTLLESNHDISVSVMDSKEPLLYVDEVIRSMYDHEVIIMCTSTDVVREIMLMANRKRLTTSNRLFFNIELFNSSSYGDGSWKRGDKNDNDAKAAYAFLNTVTLLRSTKPQFELFAMEMKKHFKKIGLTVCEECNNINMFMEGFHDALLLYALALDEAIKNGYTKENGLEITRLMWNRTFEGIAGLVSIDANGDRNGDFSVISMTDYETGAYETVMNYFGVNGSFQIMPGFNNERFTLQGEPSPPLTEQTEQSSGGLGLSAVTGILVGGLFGTALFMAFYCLRKNYRITIERKAQQELCNGKHHQLREDSIRSNFSAA